MSCRILQPIATSLEEVSDRLRGGDCVGLPTETVYGLAGNALDADAPRKIFEIKGRPLIDPLIVHVLDAAEAKRVAVLNDNAECLMKAFWPGPLTIVLPRTNAVPDLVTSGLDTVAVRSPAHPIFRKVLEISGLCLAAPSANPFGYISPTRAEHVADHLGDRLELVLDGGGCEHGVESTIVDLSSQTAKVLRPGPILPEELEAVLGEPVEMSLQHAPNSSISLKAAGSLAKHYSPRTSCFLVEEFQSEGSSGARLWLERPKVGRVRDEKFQGEHFWLSESGSTAEMLRNLYDLMHRLDKLSFDWIEIQDPGADLKKVTLRDRLKRACHQD